MPSADQVPIKLAHLTMPRPQPTCGDCNDVAVLCHVWTSGSQHDGPIDLSISRLYPKRGPSLHWEGNDTSRQAEVKHVSAYSHSDRWVGASGAWGGAWDGAGEIPWSQGICNLRCGTAFRNEKRASVP